MRKEKVEEARRKAFEKYIVEQQGHFGFKWNITQRSYNTTSSKPFDFEKRMATQYTRDLLTWFAACEWLESQTT